MNTINPPEVTQAMQIAENAHEIAASVEIDSDEMFAMAGDELRTIKSRQKQIEDLRLSLTRPLDESKKRIMDLFRNPQERLEAAAGLINGAMLAYQKAKREKAEQARKEAEAEARRERERLAEIQRAAEAEQRRIAAEAAERQRIADEAAAAARKAGDEEAARAAEAAAAKQAQIDRDEAAQAAAAAQQAAEASELADIAPTNMPTIEQPKAAGIGTRHNWKHEVTDFAALVIAAGEAAKRGDTTMLGYIEPNSVALGQVARALKGQARIPGVRIYAEEGLSVRRSVA